MADERNPVADALPAFAAAVAHEIRTPLAAVAGEVDLALCRDRSAAEYREALRRVAEGLAELVEITGDLTLLSDALEPPAMPADLDAVLSNVRERYAKYDDVMVGVDGAAAIRVPGDEARLGRAIALVLEHAVRHRRNGAGVTLRVETGHGHARLIVEAQPAGFWPRAWRSLADSSDDPATPLRLRTARRILDASGGALSLASAAGCDAVHIELPFA